MDSIRIIVRTIAGKNRLSDTPECPPVVPKLYLKLLLLWVLLLAVATTFWVSLLNLFGKDLASQLDWHSLRFYGGKAFTLGTAATAIILLAVWRSRQVPFVWQPGHLLLLFLCIYELSAVVATAVVAATYDPTRVYDPYRQSIYESQALIQSVAASMLFLVGVCRSHFGIVWRVILGTMLFSSLLVIVLLNPLQLPMGRIVSYDLLETINLVARVFIFSAVLITAVVEGALRKRRDWVHRVGVGLLLILYSPSLIYLVDLTMQ